MNCIEESACRAIDSYLSLSTRRPLYLVVPHSETTNVRNMVSVSLAPRTAQSSGSTWRTSDGKMISVREYKDIPPCLAEGFELTVCNWGTLFTEEDTRYLKGWRHAAK